MNQIFDALQLNSSFFYHFTIAVVFFVIVQFFPNKLKFVLSRREESTTKLEGQANDTFEKAKQLADSYKNEIDKTYEEVQNEMSQKKQDIVNQDHQRIKSAENEAYDFVAKKRDEFSADLNEKRNSILSETDGLTQELVSKITQ